jgi:ribosomal-protein-alanine N-acetyltransferase
MSHSSVLEFCRLSPPLQTRLTAFFSALTASGDDRWFHPHPFTAEEAARLCVYEGRDLYYAAASQDAVLAYGMLRGWDEGYEIPSLGVAVHPDARGMGLARAFMGFLHAAAACRGARRIRLKVYPGNAPARRLYEGLGYQLEPTAGDQWLGVLDLKRGEHGRK